MASEHAIQGIAQDYITLFIAVPLVLFALYFYRRNSLRGKFVLSGVLLYFLLTYLFYLAMGMYNALFLIYVALLAFSLFALILTITTFRAEETRESIGSVRIPTLAGWFLMFSSSMVAILWLSSIVPPLLSGALYPAGLYHYTTMIVQGFDLGIFLPLGFVSGLLAVKKNIWGVIFTTIYMIFLALLMSALISKILFMAKAGVNVVPAVYIMSAIFIISIVLSLLLMKNLQVSKLVPNYRI